MSTHLFDEAQHETQRQYDTYMALTQDFTVRAADVQQVFDNVRTAGGSTYFGEVLLDPDDGEEVFLDRCWREDCLTRVDPEDPLGLCEPCKTELANL